MMYSISIFLNGLCHCDLLTEPCHFTSGKLIFIHGDPLFH